jgi:hypothetical protein
MLMKLFCCFVTVNFVSASFFNSEFIKGAESGIYLSTEEQFLDYSCPEPTLSKEFDQWVKMIEPFRLVFEAMAAKKNSKLGKGPEILLTLASKLQ